MKRLLFSVLFVVLTVGVSVCFVGSAFSIPASQQKCEDDPVTNTNDGVYQVVPGSNVQVYNGTLSRICVVTFSAEVNAEDEDGVDVAYSVDFGPCMPLGNSPEAFAGGEDESDGPRLATHTNVSVTPLGPGTHYVSACFRPLDLDESYTTSATLSRRCLTIECRTQ